MIRYGSTGMYNTGMGCQQQTGFYFGAGCNQSYNPTFRPGFSIPGYHMNTGFNTFPSSVTGIHNDPWFAKNDYERAQRKVDSAVRKIRDNSQEQASMVHKIASAQSTLESLSRSLPGIQSKLNEIESTIQEAKQAADQAVARDESVDLQLASNERYQSLLACYKQRASYQALRDIAEEQSRFLHQAQECLASSQVSLDGMQESKHQLDIAIIAQQAEVTSNAQLINYSRRLTPSTQQSYEASGQNAEQLYFFMSRCRTHKLSAYVKELSDTRDRLISEQAELKGQSCGGLFSLLSGRSPGARKRIVNQLCQLCISWQADPDSESKESALRKMYVLQRLLNQYLQLGEGCFSHHEDEIPAQLSTLARSIKEYAYFTDMKSTPGLAYQYGATEPAPSAPHYSDISAAKSKITLVQ